MPIVRIQTACFSVEEELKFLCAEQKEKLSLIGATVVFIGHVREFSDHRKIQSMTLEHYPPMTEKSIMDIVYQATTRWEIIDALVIHRVGMLLPQDPIVMVAVVGGHRGTAFAACEYIMDYLKTQAPFWKKEHTPDGSRWVEAKEQDNEAVARWEAQEKTKY